MGEGGGYNQVIYVLGYPARASAEEREVMGKHVFHLHQS